MPRNRLYTILVLFSLAGYGWVGWNVIATSGHSTTPTICLFKTITHLPCPSCGATHGLLLFIRGDVAGSLAANPLGMVLALLMIVPLWIALDILRRRDSFFRTYRAIEEVINGNRWVSISAIALVAANWIWNITKAL